MAEGWTAGRANLSLGLTFLAAAIVGTAAGGYLADWYVRVNPRGMFLMSGLAMLGAIPLVLAAVYGRGLSVILGGMLLGAIPDVSQCWTDVLDHRQC